jgi:glycosyltransferase involved in cell wall biosynthesis
MDVSVAIPSHNRPIRLLWLLNALEEQTLSRDRFEILVAHDSTDETARLIDEHPLTEAGVLRQLHFEDRMPPAALRNAAWREARAPLVAFTDDDCRPEPTWLEELLTTAEARPGAIVQGATRPDPHELVLVEHSPHARTLTVKPPSPWAQTANILYPRAVLERLGGFDESFPDAAGEDTDLAQRGVEDGVEYVGEARAITNHAVHAGGLRPLLKSVWRWQAVPAVVKRHPALRDGMPLRIFWKTRHARLALAVVGLAAARRRPWLAALVVPWIAEALPQYGSGLRGRVRSLSELPGRATIDVVEMAALIRGSIKHRTLLL